MSDPNHRVAESSFPMRLGGFVADRLDGEAEVLAARWVAVLGERLGVDRERVLPSDDLLNHIPKILRRMAELIRDPSNSSVSEWIVADLGRLGELRRRQGFEMTEILAEFRILSDMILELVERWVREFMDRSVDRPGAEGIVRLVGRLMETVFLLSEITSRTYRQWTSRLTDERTAVMQSYCRLLAHELRNRLGAAETAILLLTEGNSRLDEERRAHLHELMLRSIRGARQVADDVHTLASTFDDAGALVPTIGLSLGSLIEEVLRLMRVEADAQQVELVCDGETPSVTVDAGSLQVALTNVIRNAIRYHDVKKSDRRVRLAIHRSEAAEEWIITVSDNGPGMTEDARARAFDPLARRVEGIDGEAPIEPSGLGLYLVRMALKQMGGTLRLDSATGEGTTVYMTVPEHSAHGQEEQKIEGRPDR